ncbi:MAG: hypothetical protein JNK89_00745 [Saprospiraceae bacterium]|nr:hypothetical protein [Saprospiraceae bacterium]
MLKQTFTMLTALLLAFSANAQKNENLIVRLGLNFGASTLYHNTHFQATNLVELYEFVQMSHKPPESYTWQNFEEDYGLRSRFSQPRYGLNLYFAHKLFPVFLNMEYMSSPSSYQKPMFAMALGLGKDFRPREMDFFFSGHVGLKRVFKDAGFGAETVTFSTNEEAQARLATFYNPSQPLGRQSGNLLAVRVGCGHVLGGAERAAIGAELFYELDVTNETVRQARMTNAGVNIYFRFDLAHTSF